MKNKAAGCRIMGQVKQFGIGNHFLNAESGTGNACI